MGTSEDYCLYEVKPGDSISAIAAHFGHITPTQLARINRLSTLGCGLPPVFPGQKILVPIVATGRIPIPKVRRAPGSALRVTCSNCESSRRISSIDRSDSEESDRLFVKVQAERVLSSGELIDGVLLVTPDCVLFDATQTALEQIQTTYAASRSPPTSRKSSTTESTGEHLAQAEGSPSHSPDHTGLGLCLALERISSLSTVKPLLQHEQSRLPSASTAAASDKTSGSDRTSLEDTVKPNTPTNLTESVGPDITESSLPAVSTDSPQPEALSDSGESPTLPPCTRPECQDDGSTSDTLNSPTLTKPELLMLQLTEFANPGDEPKRHRFVLSANDITHVIAFLLKVGVPGQRALHPLDSTTTEHATVHATPTPAAFASKRQKSLSSSGHRSIIEEVLEAMDTVSLTPTTCGGESGILSKEMLAELGLNFPTHWIGANMRLVYRADQDGYSLGTMYRKSRDVEDGVVLLIRDTMSTVFGAILSERPRCSQHFYGTGETCVFHWSPTFKRYDWTKKNYFFILGSAESFQVGGQSGHNAIWIDEALKYGRSEPTDTFDNPVLSGSLPAFAADITTGGSPILHSPPIAHDQSHRTQFSLDCHVPGDPHSPSMNSVPFVIDTLEIWELIS